MTHRFVKVHRPRRLCAEDLSWLLDRCDSILDGNVCRCVSFEQLDNLINDLCDRDFGGEVLKEKPVTKPLGKYVRIILGAWLHDQEALWRGSRYR